jgi:hypothetical protein
MSNVEKEYYGATTSAKNKRCKQEAETGFFFVLGGGGRLYDTWYRLHAYYV